VRCHKRGKNFAAPSFPSLLQNPGPESWRGTPKYFPGHEPEASNYPPPGLLRNHRHQRSSGKWSNNKSYMGMDALNEA